MKITKIDKVEIEIEGKEDLKHLKNALTKIGIQPTGHSKDRLSEDELRVLIELKNLL